MTSEFAVADLPRRVALTIGRALREAELPHRRAHHLSTELPSTELTN